MNDFIYFDIADKVIKAFLGEEDAGPAKNTAEPKPFKPDFVSYYDAPFTSVLIDLPGVAMEDVKVTDEGNHIKVAGTRRQHTKLGAAISGVVKDGSFELIVAAPPNVSSIDAVLKNGVLRLTIEEAKSGKPGEEIPVR